MNANLSHFETERPAGFPDQAPTENVIGAGSTRQPASSSHACRCIMFDAHCHGGEGCRVRAKRKAAEARYAEILAARGLAR